MYNVTITKKAERSAKTMPRAVQNKLKAQPLFWHYSKLGDNRDHCHIALNWVACWTCENGSINIEVYYVGSREKAPY